MDLSVVEQRYRAVLRHMTRLLTTAGRRSLRTGPSSLQDAAHR
ncbi:MAG: hypothetical protein ACRDSR_06935 [Pseudonocardiaceae bacterium]